VVIAPEALYQLPRSDIARAAPVLAAAFRQDPIWSRLFESEPRMERRQAAFEAPLRFCRRYGAVYATSPNLEGIAAFVPGEQADMTLARVVLSGGIVSGMRMGMGLARRMMPVFQPVQADRKQNMLGRAYVYLLILGVAPEHQAKGWGGRLLRAVIEYCRQRGRSLYLETETESNVRMYERFGFRTVKTITLPGLNLPMWEMARESGE
jgi:ribosomal protein S18 acetylase RimI-like enzyme